MRKVTKILLKLLSVTLLFLIFCPIVLTLTVALPSVQNFVVDRATDYISKKLDTRVEIDRIRLGALGSLYILEVDDRFPRCLHAKGVTIAFGEAVDEVDV